MSYWEDRYIDYLAEEDGQIGGDAWRDDYNPRASLEKKLMSAYESVKCPDCGGEMISRTGKFGVFWGCKDFPRCKGTRDSEERSKADREAWKSNQLENDDTDEMTAKERAKKNWNVK
jgi:ssDNA-binding Zn-finger/Zn-ribbon topoisomerase 1